MRSSSHDSFSLDPTPAMLAVVIRYHYGTVLGKGLSSGDRGLFLTV